MRLSEAMRLGASWSKQARHTLKSADGGTCALGAVVEAVWGGSDLAKFRQEFGNIARSLEVKFPLLNESVKPPQNPGVAFDKVSQIIMSLNDWHGWSRESIADWIEKLENERGLTDTKPAQTDLPAPLPSPVREVAHV